MSAAHRAHDPIADHLVGQVGGSIVLLGDVLTRLNSLTATLADVALAVVEVPGLEARPAAVLEAAIIGEVEQLMRIKTMLGTVRASLARAALRDAASLGRALRA